jgi:hypothetical protein
VDDSTRGWRLAMQDGGGASHLRRGWRLLAAVLPGVFPLLVAVLGLGLWLALVRTGDISSAERVRTLLIVTVPLALWLLVVSLLARAGAYRAQLAVTAGLLIPPAVGLLLLTRLPHLPELLDATPRSWLIGFMTIRLVGGVFLAVWASGEVAKPQFNVWAGGLDVIIGATALPLAWWVSTGAPVALATGVAWNLVGLLDFAGAIGISRTIRGAGPPAYIVSNTPVVAALRPTIVGIITFGVPLAIMVHVLSLWQLLAA